MLPANVFHGIACCVTHLYYWNNDEQVRKSEKTGSQKASSKFKSFLSDLRTSDLLTYILLYKSATQRCLMLIPRLTTKEKIKISRAGKARFIIIL